MKEYAIRFFFIIAVLGYGILTTGCASTTVPVTMNFPQAPEPLLMKPEKLDTLPEDADELSDI